MASPIEADDRIELITELLGVTAAEIRLSLDTMRGSLVLLLDTNGGQRWTFKHPTVGDAYAALVAESPELTEIYIRGAKLERLLEEVVCGNVEVRGASVRVGTSLYRPLLNRLLVHDFDYRIRYFLGQRCDAAFLKIVAQEVPSIFDLKPGPFMAYSSENRVLAKLHEAQLLPEDKRRALIEHISDVTITVQDGAVFRDKSLKFLFTDEELGNLIARIRSEVIAGIEGHVDDWRSNYQDDDPDSHFEELISFLSSMEDVFGTDDPDVAKIEKGRQSIAEAIDTLNSERGPDRSSRTETPIGRAANGDPSIQAIFDDVDR